MKNLFLGLISLLVFSNAFALTNEENQKLIDKLEKVFQNLAPADPSYLAVGLRLADLYSEKARTSANEELKAGCVQCTAGVKDRKKALQLYEDCLPKVSSDQMGKVLAQMGHLHELNGSSDKAMALYEKVINSNAEEVAKAEAHLSIAELKYRSNKFDEAQKHYQKVIDVSGARSRGLAAYKLAWCQFNLNKTDQSINGLVKILESPDLLNRHGSAGTGTQIDEEFQQEVSRDLATFFAQGKVGLDEAKKLYKLSTDKTKLENVSYLAKELERLGKDKSAVEIWQFLLDKQSGAFKKLEGHVLLASLERKAGDKEASLKNYKKALAAWAPAQKECDEKACKELKLRIKNYLIDWHKMEQKDPSEQLVSAYENYLEVFPQEIDVNAWLSDVFKIKKDYAQAAQYQAKIVSILKSTGDLKNSQLEKSLLAQVELAEMSKDNKFLAEMLNKYSAETTEKTKLFEVNYKKAKLLYDENKYEESAQALKQVATDSSSKASDIKLQAAHLSLDALTFAKNDALIEGWSKEYAKLFPQDKASFQKLSRQSVFTQTQKLAVDTKNIDQAWTTLTRTDVSDANEDEKKTFYKNKIILAEKLGKYAEARSSVDSYLAIKSLTSEERQFALAKQAWFSELDLDFNSALSATKSLPLEKGKESELYLKMALFAELAQQDSKSYYQSFLSKAKSEEALSVVESLLNQSTNVTADIEKYKKYLETDKTKMAYWSMVSYAQSQNKTVAQKIIANKSLSETASYKIVQRALIIDEVAALNDKIKNSTIRTNNQNLMAKDLKEKIETLNKIEKESQKAIDSGDWLAQVASLTCLQQQSEKLYNEVLSLPMPQGLTDAEQGQYMQLLSQQAAPFQSKSEQIKVKLAEFNQNINALDVVIEDYKKEKSSVQQLIKKSLEQTKSLATFDQATLAKIDGGLKNPEVTEKSQVTFSELEIAKKKLKEQPLSIEAIDNLIKIESKINENSPMVSYLKARKSKAQSQGVSL